MSLAKIEFDTENKTCSVTLDGEELADVKAVYIYKDYYEEDKAGIEIVRSTKLDNGMSVHTRMVASDSEEGRKSRAAGRRYATADKTLIFSFSPDEIKKLA